MKRKTEKEKMSECHLCLLGLIALSSLLTGTSGVDETHVFISSGENVRLSCNNTLHHCKSTTWLYNRFRDSAAVELIAGGKKKNTERQERLSLGSDCSLNINNISTEDYGLYTCRQCVNPKHQEPDARVFLHVLHVSQTEISAGLSCQLYSYPRVSCDDWIRSERIQLFWVNQAGVKLMRSDSRYQISSSSDHCIITLNTTLLNEDHNREWRCEVTHRDRVKASVTYTVKSSDQAQTTTPVPHSQDPSTTSTPETTAQTDSATAVTTVHSTNSQDPSTTNTPEPSSHTGNKRGTDESAVKDETINMSTPAAARDNEQTRDVTYSEVSSSSKKPVKSLKDQDDSVTYAAIR
uniref:Ig-like domain-containing protein n=1 Tax=Cyprinus carpio TaxID=7962 RepID=A0A8C1LJ80_CYPCA